MRFNITSVKIIGRPAKSGWTQIHDFEPEDENKLKLRGRIFALISVSDGGSGIEIVNLGREILGRLHEEYFGNTSGTVFYALKESLEKVKEEFVVQKGILTEISALVITDNVVYCSAFGGTLVGFYREGSFNQLLASGKSEVIVASGYPKSGDIIVLATSGFITKLGESQLLASLKEDGLEKTREFLDAKALSQEDSGNIGISLIGFNDKESEIIPNQTENYTEPVVERPKLKFRAKLAGKLDKLISKLPERRIYIRQSEGDLEKNKPGRNTMFVGVLLLVILVLSIGFGIKKKRETAFKSSYAESLSQAMHNFEEAEKLYELSPQRSRELLVEAKRIIEDLESRNIKDSELDDLKLNLESSYEKILKQYSETPELYLDITLLKDGFKPEKVTSGVDTMLAFEINNTMGALIEYQNKKTKLLESFAKVEGLIDAATYLDQVYVLTNTGLYSLDNEVELIVGKNWENGSFIYAYAANLYMLDAPSSKIYRFSAVEGGFSEGREWLSGDEVDLSKTKDWVIDGNVWILLSSGELGKFNQGVKKPFDISGVTPEITGLDAIYTNEELEHLYLLDKVGKRLLVIDKEGQYVAQYQNEKFSEFSDLTVSVDSKQAIFLGKDGKLYFINLKHI